MMNIRAKVQKLETFGCSELTENNDEISSISNLPSTWLEISNSASNTTKRRRITQKRIQQDSVSQEKFCSNLPPPAEKSKPPKKSLKYRHTTPKSGNSFVRKRALPIIYEGKRLLFYTTSKARPHIIFRDKVILAKILQFVEKKGVFEEDLPDKNKSRLNNFKTKGFVEQEVQVNRRFLYNCLMVNKVWYSVTLDLLLKNVHFTSPKNFRKFLVTYSGKCGQMWDPSSFILENIHKLAKEDLDLIESFLIPHNMKTIELYLCPYATPSVSWLSRSCSLERLIFPGNKAIDDKFLMEICTHTPKLKLLDLRACDNVTDTGVISVALRCPLLRDCNLGRRINGNKITNVSMISLAINTQIETLGLAGCQISDGGLWSLAKYRGESIKRLSLNNCNLLTNDSVPSLFAKNLFPNLLVLEIKNINQIDNLRDIALYKMCKKRLGISVWVAGCERINNLLKIEENKLNALQLPK